MPSFANSLAVSVLPMPIEPVRPMRRGRSAIAQSLLEFVAKFRRDFWFDAEEGLERRDRLIHQHTQTIDGPEAAHFGTLQKVGLKRIIDDVTYRGAFRKHIERKVDGRCAFHSGARGVHDKHGIAR